MFHNLKKKTKNPNTQDDPSATSHEKNGRVFSTLSQQILKHLQINNASFTLSTFLFKRMYTIFL